MTDVCRKYVGRQNVTGCPNWVDRRQMIFVCLTNACPKRIVGLNACLKMDGLPE